jgi:hypothetical protein
MDPAQEIPYQGVNGKQLVNDFSPGAPLGRGFFLKALLLSLFMKYRKILEAADNGKLASIRGNKKSRTMADPALVCCQEEWLVNPY